MYTDTNYKSAAEINQSMGKVYGYMGLATVVSMFVSLAVGLNHAMMQFLFTGIMHWIVVFLPLIAIFIITPIIASTQSRSVAIAALLAFSAVMGLSFSIIFVKYTMLSIFTAFMGAAILFVVMSVYGYFTKKDLSNLGSLLMIALITIIIVSIINMFIGSSMLQMIISIVGVLIFLGFTAYDTQQIREQLMEGGDNIAVEILGALNLYLDFINLFLNLLQIFGLSNNDD